MKTTILLLAALLICLAGEALSLKKIQPLAKKNPFQPGDLIPVNIPPLLVLRGGDVPTAATKATATTREITFRQDRRGVLTWLLNFLWLATVGWTMAATWFCVGLALCCTIIGFPVGYQAIKMSFFLLFPFGKSLTYDSSRSVSAKNMLLNLVWALTVGWILAGQAIVAGCFLMASIVGIPFGWQCFKFAHLCFRPFGMNYSAIEETTYVVVQEKKN